MIRIEIPAVLVSLALFAGCANSSDKPANDPSGASDNAGADATGTGAVNSNTGTGMEPGAQSTSGHPDNTVTPGSTQGSTAPSTSPGAMTGQSTSATGK